MTRRFLLGFMMLIVAAGPREEARAQRLFWLGTLGGPESKAFGVSNDGVVVGYATNLAGESRAFRWTEAGGMQDLGALILYSTHSYAYDVSEDGSVVVGHSHRPFRWTEPSGMQPIDTDHYGVASSVSYDGSLSGGWYFDGETGRDTPFRWTEASGMDILFEGANGAFVWGVSGDGSVCVGSIGAVRRAFRWTETTGVQDLGTLGGLESEAYAADEDGSVIVGHAVNTSGNRRPFRWTSSAGMTDLTSLGLVSEALDVSASGQKIVGYYVINGTEDERAVQWNLFPVLSIRNLTSHYADLLSPGSVLNRAEAISPDGRYIAGWGFNAETGRTEAFLLDTSVSTAVVEDEAVPRQAQLAGAYPNPFRLSTTLGFTVSRPGPVRLQVYDGLGRLVRSLVDEHRGVGAYQAVWDGRDAAGREVPAGVYLARFETGGHAQTRTLVVLR
ncbi:MAG: hypothetical protein KatS3mg042_1708 [Rhodothermaceae bacterium]|nr:MAG: hypothetical protein KatS3mg042_1708 [Rhodothermaceae bacterium]